MPNNIHYHIKEYIITYRQITLINDTSFSLPHFFAFAIAFITISSLPSFLFAISLAWFITFTPFMPFTGFSFISFITRCHLAISLPFFIASVIFFFTITPVELFRLFPSSIGHWFPSRADYQTPRHCFLCINIRNITHYFNSRGHAASLASLFAGCCRRRWSRRLRWLPLSPVITPLFIGTILSILFSYYVAFHLYFIVITVMSVTQPWLHSTRH